MGTDALEIIAEEENALLGRMEVKATYTHEREPTPSERVVRKALAEHYVEDPTHIRINTIASSHGSTTANIDAHIYEEAVIDEEALQEDEQVETEEEGEEGEEESEQEEEKEGGEREAEGSEENAQEADEAEEEEVTDEEAEQEESAEESTEEKEGDT